MDLMQLGAELLNNRLGLNVDQDRIATALGRLLGDGDSLNLPDLVSRVAGSGQLGGILSSWLGDGSNAPISVDGILDMLGGDEVAAFADTLGTDTQTAASGLADVLPQLIDRASSGGSLLDSVGGVGGLLGAAGSLFNR